MNQYQNNNEYEFSFLNHNLEEKYSLEVLLELINKKKIQINEIDIFDLTNQFLEYVNSTKNKVSLDVYSDYTRMSAYLIELKTRMMLPNSNDSYNSYKLSVEQERELLIKKLLEYQMYKKIIPVLESYKNRRSLMYDKSPEDFDDFLPNDIPYEKLPKKINPIKLKEAFELLLNKKYIKFQQAKKIDLHISNNEYSIEQIIYDLITYLYNKSEYKSTLIDFFKSLEIFKQNIDYYCMLFFVILSLLHHDDIVVEETENNLNIQLNNQKIKSNNMIDEFIKSIKENINER